MSNPIPIPRQHGFFIQTPLYEKLKRSRDARKWKWPDEMLRLVVQIACHPALLTASPHREEMERYFNARDFDGALAALTFARNEVNRQLKTAVGVVRFYLQCPQYGYLRADIQKRTGRQVEPSAADIIEALGKMRFSVSKQAVRTARKEQRKGLPKLKIEIREAEKYKRRQARLLLNRVKIGKNLHA